MAANTHQYQMKRTSVSGRLANTVDSSNTSYIPAGGLAVNFADKTVFTSDGTNLFQVGANVTNLNVTSTLTVNGATINSTSFSGTSNNALNLNGQPASYYTNATNITTGTLNPARLALSGVVANTYGNTSAIPVVTVDSAGRVTNVTLASVAGVSGLSYTPANSTITLTTGAGSNFTATINQANSSVAGLVEIVDSTSNTYSNVAASANSVASAYALAEYAIANASAAYSNSIVYANNIAATAYSNSINYVSNGISNGSIVSANSVYSQNSGALDGVTLTTLQSQITGNAATSYSNAIAYADTKSSAAYANAVANAAALYQTTAGLPANVATLAANSATYLGNSATTGANIASWISGNSATAFSNAIANAAANAASLYLPLTGGTINGPLTITGNVIMAGNTTFVNTTVISTTDKAIYLSANSTGPAMSDGSGIYATNAASFTYNNATTSWQANVNITPSSNALNLGTPTLSWNNLYANSGNFTTLNVSSNVNLSNSFVSNAGIIAFNPSNIIATPTPGQIWWDGGSTLNLGMSNAVTQKVGESQYFYVKASSTITLGQLVMFTGTVGSSGVITAAPSTGINDGSLIVGVAAENIPLNGFGMIQNFGTLKGFDTTGSSVGETWTAGTFLYYNPNVAGGFTMNPPVAPTPKVLIAAVLNAGNGGSGSIVIRITDYPSINDIQDIQITSASNGQVLVFNGNVWNNQNTNALTVNSASYLGNSQGTWANTLSLISNAYSNAVANAAALYQTTAGLSANVLTLTANSATYLGNSATTGANIASWISGNSSTAYTNAINYAGNGVSNGAWVAANATYSSNSGALAGVSLATLQSQIIGNATTSYTNATNWSANGVTNGAIVAANAIYSQNSGALGGSTLATVQSQITGNATTAYANAVSSAAATYLPLTGGSISGSLSVSGNLTIAGATTFVNTSVISTSDKAIYLSANSGNTTVSDGSGIVATSAATLLFNNATDSWQSNVNFTPTSNSTYNLGAVGNYWNIVYANQVYGTLMTTSQPNITANNSTNFGGLSLSTVQTQFTSNDATTYSNAVNYVTTGLSNGSIVAANATYAANAGLLGGSSLATITGYITGNSSTSYTNAIAFSANASNINTGTLAYARLPANLVFWSNTNTFTATQNFSANIAINTGVSLIDSTGSGGSTGQYLTSNGSGNVYWSSSSAGILTPIALGNVSSSIPVSPVSPGITFNTSSRYELTATGNVFLQNWSTGTPGTQLDLFITQDSTGGRNISFDTNYLIPAGSQLSGVPGAVDVVSIAIQNTGQAIVRISNGITFPPTGLTYLVNTLTVPALGSNVTATVANGYVYSNSLYVFLPANSTVNIPFIGQVIGGGGTNSLTINTISGNVGSTFSTLTPLQFYGGFGNSSLVYSSNTNTFTANQNFVNLSSTGTLTSNNLISSNATFNNHQAFNGTSFFNGTVSFYNSTLISNTLVLAANSISDINGSTAANGSILIWDNSGINGPGLTWYASYPRTANNATNFGGLSLATVQGQITGNAATAYANAIVFAANASNINSGSIGVAYLPANVVFWSNTNTFTAPQAINANLTIDATGASQLAVGTTFTANSTTVYLSNTSGNVTIVPYGITVAANGLGYFKLGNTTAYSTTNASGLYTSGNVSASQFVISTINSTSSGFLANSTALTLGSSLVSISINATSFSGTANNATNLGGVAATNYYYTNNQSSFANSTNGFGISGTSANTSALLGYTWATPGSLGATVANTANVTTLSTGNTTVVGSLTSSGGVITLGGASDTSNIILGQSTLTQSISIGNGVTSSGNTKTINIGTGAASGATSTITIGSSTSGSIQTTTINGRITLAPIGGSLSAWSTSGVGLIQSASTWTDTSTLAGGTVTTAYMNLFDSQTYAATNTGITVTSLYGTYFKTPITGTNVTAGQKYALAADSITSIGLLLAQGNMTVYGGLQPAGGFQANVNANFAVIGQTTYGITLGGVSQTASIVLGQSTVTQTVNIASGVTASGSTKTLTLGTGGASGSTTAITIGATAGTSTTTINGSIITASLTGVLVGNGASNVTAVTAPSGTIVGTTDTQTLTNKWVQPRVLASTANSATPTLNTDSYDMMVITGQTVAITSFTTNLTGTPVNGQKLWISITGTGAIAITWGAKFEASTVALPTTTVSTNRLDVGFIWNAATSAWRCVGAV